MCDGHSEFAGLDPGALRDAGSGCRALGASPRRNTPGGSKDSHNGLIEMDENGSANQSQIAQAAMPARICGLTIFGSFGFNVCYVFECVARNFGLFLRCSALLPYVI